MNEKKKIKKLAKECLKDKWYPFKRGEEGIQISDSCAFCEEYINCWRCYIEKIIPDFCMRMSIKNIDYVIEILEQLANFGEL